MDYSIKIKKICHSNPETSGAYSMLFETKPEKRFLDKFGKFYILININLKKKSDTIISQAKEFGQKLFNFSESNYYDPLKTAQNIEKEFENLLQKINKWLTREKMLFNTFFKDDIASMDIAIILVKKENIYFSQINNINIYLVQNKKITNLTEENDSDTFQNIVNGSLKKNDILFFTSKNLFDYIINNKIINFDNLLLSDNPTDQMIQSIKNIKTNLLILIIFAKKELKIGSFKENLIKKMPVLPENDSHEIKEPPLKKPKKEHKIFIKNLSKLMPKKVKFQQPQKRNTMLATKFKNFSSVKKILLIILIILAILFIASLIILGKEELRVKEEQNYNELIKNLETQQQILSVNLIYKNKTKIKEALNNINILLEKFPKKTFQEKKDFEKFNNEYLNNLNKFYKLNIIKKPKILFDIQQINKDIKLDGMVRSGNILYIFDSNKNFIYNLNTKTGEIKLVNNTSFNIGHIKKLVRFDEDTLLGIDSKNQLVSFNTIDQKLIPLKINFEDASETIQDIAVYEKKLYILKNNKIYKYTKTINGFGNEKKWLKITDIPNSQKLAIDSSIYVLTKTNEILKFYQGKQNKFSLEEIYPPAKNFSKIITNIDIKNLYLLDPPQKRIVIFNKNGQLLKQFKINDSLNDFEINSSETKIWLLSKTKIFEIEL